MRVRLGNLRNDEGLNELLAVLTLCLFWKKAGHHASGNSHHGKLEGRIDSQAHPGAAGLVDVADLKVNNGDSPLEAKPA